LNSSIRKFVDSTMPVRVAVIGVGHLGQHHARLLASMDGVDLVGVCDVNRARADEIGRKFGAPGIQRRT
jgi:predicted dehydrogenase